MRFKAYLQLEHSDCGPTCLRMVARHYGRSIPRSCIRELCDCNRAGITLNEMVSAARKIGFLSEAVKIGMSDLERMPLPAVLLWKNTHFVVLHRHNPARGVYHIADPSCGNVRVSEEDFIKHWADTEGRGVAILFEPTDKFYTRHFAGKKTEGLAAMAMKTLHRERSRFAAVILLLLFASAADVVTPFLFQATVDDGIRNHDIPLVWILILCQFLIFLGNYISSASYELILTRLGLRTAMRMMDTYLRKLASLPIGFFDRKVNSDLMQKTDDQNSICSFLLEIPQTIFLTLLNITLFSALLIWFSPLIFAIFIVMTGLGIGWAAIFSRRRRELNYALSPRRAENRNHLYELIYGMTEIKANNALANRLSKWLETQKEINRLSYSSTIQNMIINGGNTFINRLKDIAVVGICATIVIQGEMTVGGMMTVSYITGRLSVPLAGLVSLWLRCQDASMSYERLEEIMEHEESAEGSLPVPPGDIVLRDVAFRYSGAASRNVLDGLSLTIPRGKTTAIVGPSGCGKTTLLKLLLKFYPPAEGTICVGDSSLEEISPEHWAAETGAVMQNGHLFAGSIAANIAIGEDEPDMERVRKAARIASLDSFISSLPMEYSTNIGTTGMSLSGGQTQRLLIARALYRNPSIVILDEATSSLDAGNEREIVSNLCSFCENRTLIIVAHRLSTVRNADLIHFMKEGRIIESGSHSELLAMQGHYHRLVSNQLETDAIPTATPLP